MSDYIFLKKSEICRNVGFSNVLQIAMRLTVLVSMAAYLLQRDIARKEAAGSSEMSALTYTTKYNTASHARIYYCS
jgi:hypothetical protein